MFPIQLFIQWNYELDKILVIVGFLLLSKIDSGHKLYN